MADAYSQTQYGGGSSFGSSSTSPGMVPGMMGVYNQLLNINQQRYGNVLQAYTSGLSRMETQLAGIYGGFQNLQNRELRLLGLGGGGWGFAKPAYDAIKRQFEWTGGQQQQAMIARGLGNTTVGANLAQQNALYETQEFRNLGLQLAQTGAGVVERTGLAGLSAQMQGIGMEGNYTLGGLSALGQPIANTAGQLFGAYGTSTQGSYQTSGGAGGGGGGSGGGGSGGGGLGGTGYYSNPYRFAGAAPSGVGSGGVYGWSQTPGNYYYNYPPDVYGGAAYGGSYGGDGSVVEDDSGGGTWVD